jgi:penicillin G amidase
MATTVVAASTPRKNWWTFSTLLAAALLVLLVAGLGGWLYSVARSALPQLDGSISLPGLSGRVTVTRDVHGAPTIEASSLEDLFFAQGYETAQDRLWQMDILRRFVAGEVSEVLGPEFIKHDREQRILGLRLAAKHAAAISLNARDRGFFEAYVRGLNAFIDSHRDRLPIEFRILRYLPQPWTVEDSILIGAGMVQDLNHYSYKRALARERILAKLGPELTADLYVNSSWRDHPPSAPPLRMDQEEDMHREHKVLGNPITGITDQTLPFAPTLADDPLLASGSNNWVISGAHTVTGKPLLSNDMHLTHQMPNLWYEAHLRFGQFDVVGVTLPGMPFVIVGHNQRIGWGFTNLGPTVEDIYIENFNNTGQYQTPEGWKNPDHRQEIIHVKGQRDVLVEVTSTRHGPIISELIPGENRKLALRWTLYDSLYDPFFDVDSASNWSEFRKALAPWDSPSQNAVYADVDGHIGYQATGHIPIRGEGDGSLPVNGSDDFHEWIGYVPFDELPSAYDPPSGIVATANGRITADEYPRSLSAEWGAPWRTRRIYSVLGSSGKKFTAADMLTLQTDVYSEFDRFCAERFVYALDHGTGISDRARQAREIMREWDGRLTADSAAATIETSARRKLEQFLLQPKLGPSLPPEFGQGSEEDVPSWKDYRWFMSSIWLENVLLKEPKRWLPSNFISYEALLTAAVEAAIAPPSAPGDLSLWHWGNFAPVHIEHPILSRLPLVGRWTSPGLQPQSGGGYTVKQVGRTFGPSERLTVDLGNLDQSTLNLVTGESGNFLSPYYMDQWQAWYQGSTYPLPFSEQAVQSAKQHVMILEPAR